MTSNFRVLEAAYHRNGVGGEGFYVGIIALHREERRLLVTWFPELDAEGEIRGGHQSRIAVVDLDIASTGNIHMHPQGEHPGGNAFRGADHFGEAARAIKAMVDTQWTDQNQARDGGNR